MEQSTRWEMHHCGVTSSCTTYRIRNNSMYVCGPQRWTRTNMPLCRWHLDSLGPAYIAGTAAEGCRLSIITVMSVCRYHVAMAQKHTTTYYFFSSRSVSTAGIGTEASMQQYHCLMFLHAVGCPCLNVTSSVQYVASCHGAVLAAT